VVESRAKALKPGDMVVSNLGWREYGVASAEQLQPVSPEIQPLSAYLGALGMTGMTAWAGLNLVEVKSGDIVFISGAVGGKPHERTSHLSLARAILRRGRAATAFCHALALGAPRRPGPTIALSPDIIALTPPSGAPCCARGRR
jgi:hypothetical protein